jgi:catechol 2,3-dioxygenase
MFGAIDINSSGVGGPEPVIAPEISMGPVRLRVRDLAVCSAFYAQALGMAVTEQAEGTLQLGVVAGGPPLLELHEDRDASPVDISRPGLFHFALLVPSRIELAAALLRLVRMRWPLSGASDHLVSEALYLADPEGNGIEIAWDRPREEWRTTETGELAMATLPLDIEGLLGLLDPAWTSVSVRKMMPLPPRTKIGHMHLQVSDLKQTERFYCDLLGFELRTRAYPGALFVAADGYHHHLGLNTWHSRGSEPALADAAGLESFQLRVGTEEGLDALLLRLAAAGIPTESLDDGLTRVRDPDGIEIVLRS